MVSEIQCLQFSTVEQEENKWQFSLSVADWLILGLFQCCASLYFETLLISQMEFVKKIATYGKQIKNLHIFTRINYLSYKNAPSVPASPCKSLRSCYYLCVIGSFIFWIQNSVLCVWLVQGRSNEPTLYDGDILSVSC